MITLQELVADLETLYPPGDIADFCANGLQVEGVGEISKVATGVTADLATVREAAQWGAQALIVHHGLFWDREQVSLTGTMRKKVALLIEAGISLLAFHLPMDMHQEVGNNWNAAADLGLERLKPFADLGVQGLIRPMAIGEWVEKVGSYYGSEVRAALGGPEEVTSVTILSGASHKMFSQVRTDCYITGTCDEKQWREAHEEGMHFLSVGHHNSEKIGPRVLADHVAKRYEIEARFLDVPNPF